MKKVKKVTKYWTVASVMKLGPCYLREQVQAHFGTTRRLTLRQILDLTTVPASDRVWIACRPSALSPARLKAWQAVVLTRAITNHALHCGIPIVEQWAVRWLSGEDRTKASAARAAGTARAARAAGTARAAKAAGTARAVWTARAARAAEAAWTARAARAAEAAWAVWTAEYQQQITDLITILDRSTTRRTSR